MENSSKIPNMRGCALMTIAAWILFIAIVVVAVLFAQSVFFSEKVEAAGEMALVWDASVSCVEADSCDYRVYTKAIGTGTYPSIAMGYTTGLTYPIPSTKACYVVTAVALADPETESEYSNEVCYNGYWTNGQGKLDAPGGLHIERK